MKKIATTLVAAACFALLSPPARAIELLVIVTPEDAIRGVGDAWDAANVARYSMWGSRNAAARSNAQQLLQGAQAYMDVADTFLNRAQEDLAIIAVLNPRDPMCQELIGEFEYNTAVAHSYMSVGVQLVYYAASQPDPVVRYYCAPAVSAATEAVSRTARLQNQSIEETLDGLDLGPLRL